MLTVVEAFSGIGAQAKALERIKDRLGYDFKILNTIDWDVNAILAYDLIHNGPQNLEAYADLSKKEILDKLVGYHLSPNGKEPYSEKALARNSSELLVKLLCAIERTHNLVSVTDVKGSDLPAEFDVLTYSFPCQNLSIASVVHGYMTGIDKSVKNRSGMLWEIERILKERTDEKLNLPKFLLMENVSTLVSPRHRPHFEEWQETLVEMGYMNIVYRLKANRFETPQARDRLYMISVFIGRGNERRTDIEERIKNDYLVRYGLQENAEMYSQKIGIKKTSLSDIIKDDYSIPKYKEEAEKSQLNDTGSRKEIVRKNAAILWYKGNEKHYDTILRTITTKQDRHPTTGLVEFRNGKDGKLPYRYITPRECFLGMGFDEKDYEAVINENFMNGRFPFFTGTKLEKMAGNSIVVNVLEAIFAQINEIKDLYLDDF